MLLQKNKKLTTSDLVLIAMFTAVISICAWIAIPMTVPFTMQTFGVFLTLNVLGGKRGTLAIANYLFLGMIGVPVFSGFRGGIGCLFDTTGGYIVGFLFSGLVVWGMEAWFGKKKQIVVISMILGLLICYVFGTIWFLILYANNIGQVGVWMALSWCVFPYMIPDIVKIVFVFVVSQRMEHMLCH